MHDRLNTARTDPWGFYRISPSSGDPLTLAAELEVRPRVRAVRAALRSATRQFGPKKARVPESAPLRCK